MNGKLILGTLLAGVGGMMPDVMDLRTILYGFGMAGGALFIHMGLFEKSK